ncbi:MAG: hypothetical protein QXK47_02340 [Candidatus Bathyarchaeia archaeon]
MPWEETEDYIRSGHVDPDKFDKDSLRTIDIDSEKGIKAVVGCPKGHFEGGKCKVGMEVQSFLFAKDKGWTMDKAKDWFEKHKESKETEEFKPQKFLIREKLVPFKFQALAAKPGKSLNNRVYTADVLRQAAPLYRGKPFIMDHDVESVEKVLGVITDSKYDDEKQGLFVEGVGLMDKDLFDKVKGTDVTPPLIKNVSIGGEGEGEYKFGSVELSKFIPEELSLTAFPGIPEAQLIQIEAIRESFKAAVEKKPEIKETKTEGEVVMDVPLEEAQKIVEQDRKPTSPDSKFVTPPKVAGASPIMGGPQTGGYAEPAKPEPPATSPPSEVPKVSTVKPKENLVVDTKSVSVPPGQVAAFEVASTADIVERAKQLVKQMNGDAKKAYWAAVHEILRSQQ